MKRLLIIYNSRSSKFDTVKKAVLDEARGLCGFLVGKYEIRPTDADDNAERIAKLIQDGDTVVVAGGDGTATIAMNGLMLSGKNAKLGVLGYGNFNDFARAVGGVGEDLKKVLSSEKIEQWWPLEVKVNDKHWRYAAGYATMGLFAESTEVFDDAKVRKKLQTGKMGMIYSVRVLVKWFLKNKKRTFLPEFEWNGKKMAKGTTDFIVTNGETMAKIIKCKACWNDSRKYQSGAKKLNSLYTMIKMMLKSMSSGIELKESSGDLLNFKVPATVEMHVEGEYKKINDVKKIEIGKAEKSFSIIVLK